MMSVLPIVGETVSGSGTSWTLANVPKSGSVKLYGSGVRLDVGNDYSITGPAISTLNSYPEGSLIADYCK
jgi:hypothetical protein